MFLMHFHAQAEEQLIPIFHDKGMRQQVKISVRYSDSLSTLFGLFTYLLCAGTVFICFYSSKRDTSLKTVCPDIPPESIASSDTAVFNIPSSQFTWFYSGKTM
jgi:hypothetical protein